MRGVGEASGAITFVNAIPTGIGAAAAIGLPVRAEVRIETVAPSGPIEVELSGGNLTPLLSASVRAAAHRFGRGEGARVLLSLQSEVPVARGLKSSSAVSGAIVRAVAAAYDEHISSADAARLSAEVSREIGLSATGAFDDAYASLAGGGAITDNRADRVLRRFTLPEELDVLLWIPSGTHSASPEHRARFQQAAAEGQAAVDAAVAGDLLEAMRRNTALVERLMEYSYAPIRNQLEARGAVAAGVSGLGPALAVLVPPASTELVRELLPTTDAQVRAVRFRSADPGTAEDP